MIIAKSEESLAQRDEYLDLPLTYKLPRFLLAIEIKCRNNSINVWNQPTILDD